MLKVTVVERPQTGRSTTVTFSTFVGDELRMLGRPVFVDKHGNQSEWIKKNHKYFA